jgi:hypothetical protein
MKPTTNLFTISPGTKTFLRDNFYVLLMSALFIFTFLFWYYNRNPDLTVPLKEFCQGVFYGLLALIGVRPRATPTINADNISADNIETATTQTGDINTPKTTPADPAKDEIKENEIPTD